MKTKTKIWLIIAAFLVLLGCVLFAGVMTTLKWDFMDLATVNYETNTYEISQAFDSISMNTDTADIAFEVSDDGKCRVECREEENAKHSVMIENSTLTVGLIEERTVYDFIGYIGLNFDTPKIIVYLPKTEYTSLLIDESTGDIEIPKDFSFTTLKIDGDTSDIDCFASVTNTIEVEVSTGNININTITAGLLNLTTTTGDIKVNSVPVKNNIDIKTDTGDVTLTDVSCTNLVAKSDTGTITLNNVGATGSLSIESDTGDIRFEDSDATQISVTTNTGDVTGTLLTDKVFITETSTGRIRVPKTTSGGKCEIATDTGDIKIDVTH